MTEAEAAPVLRRFPWVQLVFCLACLSMAAWTWMRYSYTWRTTAGLIERSWREGQQGTWPHRARVRFHAVATEVEDAEGGIIQCHLRSAANELPGITLWVSATASCDMPQLGPGDHVGRVYYTPVPKWNWKEWSSVPWLIIVDSIDSRFTAESITGLVVGAMGVFIFGLYLRAWLRERKALAGEPGRDTIA